MAEFDTVIEEIRIVDGCILMEANLPVNLYPAAGQYFSAAMQGGEQILPVWLYPAQDGQGKLLLGGELPASWQPGQVLGLRGPLGKGFQMPKTARRVGLVALDGSLLPLSPLVRQALAQQAALVCYTNALPNFLPADAEVSPLEYLADLWAWADYVAVLVALRSLDGLRARLGLARDAPAALAVEVLVHFPLVCAGLSDCGVCAVPLRRGWALACKDGPVFNLNQLEG